MAKTKTTGAKQIQRNLIRIENNVKKGVLAGMVRSAMLIRNATEKELPVTPRDLGNLRASWFVTTAEGQVKKGTRNTGVFVEVNKGERKRPEGFAARMTARHNQIVGRNINRCKSSKKLMLIMGYSANYALWVHEMPEATNWSFQGSGPKWFERKLKTHRKEMLALIGKDAKIKMVKVFAETKQFKARTEISNIKGDNE